ncbi:MAG: LEA type 2 family protein [Gammaproteobacteria bacterium]|nr:LEA type 2 family protein [Gammaproteobacteria bacterium]
MSRKQSKMTLAVIVALWLSGCAASLERMLQSPTVELTAVEVLGLGFNNQTFLLSFDVNNPNAFALPIDAVSYGVKLNGQRFASGETASEFSVPAGGDAQFAISVELDLLQTAPQLLSIVREGVRGEIPYELDGKLTLGLPLTAPLSFSNSGAIRLQSTAY